MPARVFELRVTELPESLTKKQSILSELAA